MLGFFPVDQRSLDYLVKTSREAKSVEYITAYLKAAGMFRDFNNENQDPVFSEVHHLDLATVVPSLSGPKRPHDRVPSAEMKEDFRACLAAPVGFKGFAIPEDKRATSIPFQYEGQEFLLRHGSVLIAAITSCTNTSNPRSDISPHQLITRYSLQCDVGSRPPGQKSSGDGLKGGALHQN